MNKIFVKGNNFSKPLRILRVGPCRRNHTEDDKKQGKEDQPRDPRGQGILHDKQQSVHEESFFRKEEIEQLKELKKKTKKEGEKKNAGESDRKV